MAIVALAGCDLVYGLGGRVPVDAPIDAPPAYVQEVLADQPLAYYRMGEPSGVTCVDSIGDRDGTYGGNVTLGSPSAIAGDADTSVTFGPGNAGATFGDIFDFEGSKSFSLEAWILVTNDGHFNNLVNKYEDPSVATGYLLYSGYGRLACARGVTQANQTLVELDSFETDRVYHVVCTFDGAMLRLFIDGRLWEEKSGAEVILPPQDIGFVIGAGNGSISSGATEGRIDEVAIYSSALPADRVNAHFVAGSTPSI